MRLPYSLQCTQSSVLFHWHPPQPPPAPHRLAPLVRLQLFQNALRISSGGSLLAAVTLFDVYRGEQIGAGKKSLAYSLTYQAPDRTLTDADVAKVRAKIIRHLQVGLGTTLRGRGRNKRAQPEERPRPATLNA